VIDIFGQRGCKRIDIVPENVPGFPHRFANGQFGPEIAIGDIVKGENDRHRKHSQQRDDSLKKAGLSLGHNGRDYTSQISSQPRLWGAQLLRSGEQQLRKSADPNGVSSLKSTPCVAGTIAAYDLATSMIRAAI
jgi:hypothetical protein